MESKKKQTPQNPRDPAPETEEISNRPTGSAQNITNPAQKSSKKDLSLPLKTSEKDDKYDLSSPHQGGAYRTLATSAAAVTPTVVSVAIPALYKLPKEDDTPKKDETPKNSEWSFIDVRREEAPQINFQWIRDTTSDRVVGAYTVGIADVLRVNNV